jgi:hypothetical protein
MVPDHVLLGADGETHRREVLAGSFAGWLAAPTALIWSFSQGRGHLTITTLRLAPGSGPAATVLLEALIEYVATLEPS